MDNKLSSCPYEVAKAYSTAAAITTSSSLRTYGKHGSIQYRTTIKSLLLRIWSNGFWLHVYPATIYIFHTMCDLELWKTLNDISSSSLSCTACSMVKKIMCNLVRGQINFDTTDAISLLSNATTIPQNLNSSSCRGGIPIKYAMEGVRSKYYRKNQPLLYTFKISYLGMKGRVIHAAFGSTKQTELQRLRSVIQYIIHSTRRARRKQRKMMKEKNNYYHCLGNNDNGGTSTGIVVCRLINEGSSIV